MDRRPHDPTATRIRDVQSAVLGGVRMGSVTRKEYPFVRIVGGRLLLFATGHPRVEPYKEGLLYRSTLVHLTLRLVSS